MNVRDRAFLIEDSLTDNVMIDQYDFHDGCLIDIQSGIDWIVFSLESAEISEDELVEDISLSDQATIRGKLHLNGIESIKINNTTIDVLRKEYDYGEIFDFEIDDDIVLFVITWINCYPKPHFESDLFKIEVRAKKIYWENIPNLVNPFR